MNACKRTDDSMFFTNGDKKKINIILLSDMTDAGAITTVFQLERKRTITPEQHKYK